MFLWKGSLADALDSYVYFQKAPLKKEEIICLVSDDDDDDKQESDADFMKKAYLPKISDVASIQGFEQAQAEAVRKVNLRIHRQGQYQGQG